MGSKLVCNGTVVVLIEETDSVSTRAILHHYYLLWRKILTLLVISVLDTFQGSCKTLPNTRKVLQSKDKVGIKEGRRKVINERGRKGKTERKKKGRKKENKKRETWYVLIKTIETSDTKRTRRKVSEASSLSPLPFFNVFLTENSPFQVILLTEFSVIPLEVRKRTQGGRESKALDTRT